MSIKKRSNIKVNRFSTNKKILSLGTFIRNIKALALTVQKLLAKLKFSKNGSNSKVKVTGKKNNGTHGINTLCLRTIKLVLFQYYKNKKFVYYQTLKPLT